ncbi:MAG TPA: ParB/RepB/Spo0J family partition protein [Mycobacteriales bacterium]|nr:ParB/RepB/Spo0J family partition protein [Mycobacteriales bacterium]
MAGLPRRAVQEIPVLRIRPEAGLGRKRDREGHRELQESIAQFGVLTPITVRLAPDGSGDYLLVKGQGRTLACRLLGLDTVPAIVVDDRYAEQEKVQQFLVENVARLKMRPIDRALLIHRAREDGEETSAIAKRFGLAPATVRRLLTQLEGATKREVAALRAGNVSLAVHAVVVRHVDAQERSGVLTAVSRSTTTAKELEGLFAALGWKKLVDLGPDFRTQRLILIGWALDILESLPSVSARERLEQLAMRFPVAFEGTGPRLALVSR